MFPVSQIKLPSKVELAHLLIFIHLTQEMTKDSTIVVSWHIAQSILGSIVSCIIKAWSPLSSVSLSLEEGVVNSLREK
jgi:hypothetical protein